MTTSVTKKSESTSLATMLEAATPAIKAIAPKYVDVNRLYALAIEAYKRPELRECNPISVVEFCKKCAEWGTDRIGAGGVWAVKYGNSLTPIPDWRLLIHKAKLAGAITHARPDVIYSNEEYVCERGLTPVLVHKQKFADRGNPVAVYCVYTLPDGTKDFVSMDWPEVMHIKAKSKSKSGPWATDEVQMALKTVVKRTMKLFEGECPELANMIKADNDVIGYDLPESRPAVTMPTEIPVEEVQSKIVDPKQEPVEDALPFGDEPEAEPEGNVVTGIVEKVSVKTGSGKKGAWTKFGILIGGEWYGTFDKKIGELAQELEGKEAKLKWEEDGKFKTALGIKPVEGSASSESEEALVDEIQGLAVDIDESDFVKIAKDAGVDIEQGQAWEIADIDALRTIRNAMKRSQK